MFHPFLALAVTIAFSPFISAAEEVKEIDLKGLKLARVAAQPKPIEIANAEQLQKTVANKDAADAIAKQVDFSKQKLVYFAWSGSGQDKITAEKGKDAVRFVHVLGRTRDLREHHRMFVLGEDEVWAFGGK